MLSPELRLTQAGGSRKHSRPLHRPAYAAEELVLTQEKLNSIQENEKFNKLNNDFEEKVNELNKAKINMMN